MWDIFGGDLHAANVHEPLSWLGRVPMGQKGFLTYQLQLSRLSTQVVLPFGELG